MIASVSHELRTPLTSVVGFAKLLEIEGSDLGAEERAMVIRTIAEEGVDLANIIDDLLVAAKAESGTLEVVSVPTDLRAQAAQVVEACRLEDVRRIDVSPDTVRGEGDPARVRQILRNLVSNAIRYGGDQIGIEFEHDQGWAVVRVVDDGPGIPDEKRDRVFESYYRGEEDPGLAGSMGLGLSLPTARRAYAWLVVLLLRRERERLRASSTRHQGDGDPRSHPGVSSGSSCPGTQSLAYSPTHEAICSEPFGSANLGSDLASRIGRRVHIHVGVARSDLVDQSRQRLSGERADQVFGGDDPLGENPAGRSGYQHRRRPVRVEEGHHTTIRSRCPNVNVRLEDVVEVCHDQLVFEGHAVLAQLESGDPVGLAIDSGNLVGTCQWGRVEVAAVVGSSRQGHRNGQDSCDCKRK